LHSRGSSGGVRWRLGTARRNFTKLRTTALLISKLKAASMLREGVITFRDIVGKLDALPSSVTSAVDAGVIELTG